MGGSPNIDLHRRCREISVGRRLVDAEQSDLFDVLAYVAYAEPLLTRFERAARARPYLSSFNTNQQRFLDFVLAHYVNVGVYELDLEKLNPLLRLKYQNSLADTVADLGKTDEIKGLFIGFQKYLYQQQQLAA